MDGCVLSCTLSDDPHFGLELELLGLVQKLVLGRTERDSKLCLNWHTSVRFSVTSQSRRCCFWLGRARQSTCAFLQAVETTTPMHKNMCVSSQVDELASTGNGRACCAWCSVFVNTGQQLSGVRSVNPTELGAVECCHSVSFRSQNMTNSELTSVCIEIVHSMTVLDTCVHGLVVCDMCGMCDICGVCGMCDIRMFECHPVRFGF